MIINWYGESCFRVQSGDLDILIDPFESEVGLTPPRFKASLIIKTLTKAELLSSEQKRESLVLGGAGDYEVGGVEIRGFQASGSDEEFIKTVYILNLEGFRIGLLGHLSTSLEADVEDALAGSDILIIPAGGKPLLEPAEAAKLVKKLEAKIIIPSLFKVPGLKRNALDIKEFVKILGFDFDSPTGGQEKLVIKKKDLTNAKPKIIILKI